MLPADGTVTIVAQTATAITATITPAKGGILPLQLKVSVNGAALSDLPALTVTAK
jgi:hypothetical protein